MAQKNEPHQKLPNDAPSLHTDQMRIHQIKADQQPLALTPSHHENGTCAASAVPILDGLYQIVPCLAQMI